MLKPKAKPKTTKPKPAPKGALAVTAKPANRPKHWPDENTVQLTTIVPDWLASLIKTAEFRAWARENKPLDFILKK
jgi:hypothetical protein